VCPRQSRPAAFKRSSGEHNEALWHLFWAATLKAKRRPGARLRVRSLGTIFVGNPRGKAAQEASRVETRGRTELVRSPVC
jgi:hypothetical protein